MKSNSLSSILAMSAMLGASKISIDTALSKTDSGRVARAGKRGQVILTPESQAELLALGWIRHFRGQDDAITITNSEQAYCRLVSKDILLVGIVDAEAFTSRADKFFMEFKTANPRSKKTWKRDWVSNPQSLTYCLLTGHRRFTVRKAFKEASPTYDHAWFDVTDDEVEWWRKEVLDIGQEIMQYRSQERLHWPMNIEHGCYAYGPNYPCPQVSTCTSRKFSARAAKGVGVLEPAEFPEFTGANRERLLQAILDHKPLVILSATRIKTWMRCRELWRNLYDVGVQQEVGEALLVGSAFHGLLGKYYESKIKG